MKTKNEVRSRIEIDGTVIEITKGTDELSESPGRIGLFITTTWGGCSVKTYFDDPRALYELWRWIHAVDMAMKQIDEMENL